MQLYLRPSGFDTAAGRPGRLRQTLSGRNWQASQRPQLTPDGVGIVAGVGQAVIDAQLHAAADDLGLGPVRSSGAWMANRSRPSTPALVARLASRGEGGDVFRPAVGIAAVVDGVDAEEDVGRPDRPRHRPTPATSSTVLRAGT